MPSKPISKPSFLSRGPELRLPRLSRPQRSRPRRPQPRPRSGGSPARGRLAGGGIVGLDIQPGYAVAVQAQCNGSLYVRHAAEVALAGGALPEGDVSDDDALRDGLRELFSDGRLGKRVRVGIANQRTVLRTLELPPLDNPRELAAAVRFQAEDQLPMPIDTVVLDFHSVGVFDTPAGPRQRVVVVAAQRERVDRLIAAVRSAGLRPEGLDLSSFALIRSLHRPGPEDAERVLYLNVGGLTNLAIAEGTICRFTRAVVPGLESMAARIAARHEIPLERARALLASTTSSGQAVPDARHEISARRSGPLLVPESLLVGAGAPGNGWSDLSRPGESLLRDAPDRTAAVPAEEREREREREHRPRLDSETGDTGDLRAVLQDGVREIVGEVRNSLDFYISQQEGAAPTEIMLSGPALDIDGFADLLESELGIAVIDRCVRYAPGVPETVSAHRLAVAAGLTIEEAPR